MGHTRLMPFSMSHCALALFVAIFLVGTTHASMTFNWREYASSDSTCAGSVYRSFTLTSSATPVSGQSTPCLPLTVQSITNNCANLCSTSTTDLCTFQMYSSADCSGTELSGVVSTFQGTNSGQCLKEADDDEYIKNTMTVTGCPTSAPTSNSAAKHFTLSVVTMFFALVLQGAGHF